MQHVNVSGTELQFASGEEGAAPEPGAGGGQFDPLADELYRERVLEARAMAPEEKLLAGEELFDYACSITLAGIRNQFPEASEAECRRMLEARLELRDRMERNP
jgi:hypothetical protein